MTMMFGNAAQAATPPADLAEAKARKLALLADRRWVCTQTFSYDNETDVPADPAANIVNSTLSFRDRYGLPPEAPQKWKLKSPGVFRSWDYAAIETYGFAIALHIQACFDREDQLTTLIWAAETTAELDAIDITTGWPG